MKGTRRVSRRSVLRSAAAAALPLVHVRTAGAAGRLTVGFWDHWVPGCNDVMRKLVETWAARTKTEVQLDFITSVGSKLLITIAAEAEAKTGHDVMAFATWEVQNHAGDLEPMDEQVKRLSAKYGTLPKLADYLANVEGSYRAVPAIVGSQYKPACSRIDLFRQFAGMDLPAMFPAAGQMGPGYDQWIWETFLTAAEKLAATPFGLTMGQTSDAVDWVGALFLGFGAELVDAKGAITVKSDNVRKVLDYARRLMKFVPADVYSWDDASNNRALISGKSALIFNPPSAWAVAVRDNPSVGSQCWTHPMPAGEHGRYVPYLPFFWGVWKFAQNKSAAKDLIEWLSEREQAQVLCTASPGYDIPPFDSMLDFRVWSEEQPPKGTLYNYPLRPTHRAEASIAAYPAPPEIAVQIYNQATMTKMIAKVAQSGQKIDDVIAWAEGELAGFAR